MAIANSLQQNETPAAISQETFRVSMEADTSIVITPTRIKAIYNVTIFPNEATGGNWTATYISAFKFGDPKITFTAQANTVWFVTLYGTQA